MFLSSVQAMSPPFFTLSPAKSQWGGIVGFINLGMGKSRWYGIGSLMRRSSITISSELLTMQQQLGSTKWIGSRCGKRTSPRCGRSMICSSSWKKRKKATQKTTRKTVREREDFHEHAAEHEHEEQREAETDVQGQDDGQNVRDDSGDSKTNDNRQDNEEVRRANPEIVHSSQTLNWSWKKCVYISSFCCFSILIFCRAFDIYFLDDIGFPNTVAAE